MSYCTANLSDLSVDLAREYVIEQLIPMAYPLTSGFSAIDRKETLSRVYGLSDNPSKSTIWEWMTRAGFKYGKRKKRYFVDTHESKANRQYRKEQTARYLRREQRMFRWYQLPIEDAERLAFEGFMVAGRGYHYETNEGKKMVELHVDDVPEYKIDEKKNCEPITHHH